MISFTVPGRPIPQGSMKAFVRGNHAHLTSDNPALKDWRAAVGGAMRMDRLSSPGGARCDGLATAAPASPSGISSYMPVIRARPEICWSQRDHRSQERAA